jgi:tetratricopeptide (TPR) repeat protein
MGSADDTPPMNVEPAAHALERGASVGRYLIVDQLGAGGMGVVYKAFDPELGRTVALKLLKTEDGASQTSRERLLREAQALARLSHPNVVAVHDVGTLGGDVFVAMEFIEGQTMRAWLKEKPRSQRAVIDVFVAAGQGLAAAHRASLVHRDFKPDNVIVGNDGRVRVLDFGLARDAHTEEKPGAAPPAADRPLDQTSATRVLAGSSDPPAPEPASAPAADDWVSAEGTRDRLLSPLTHAGTVMGTPRFMPPEQYMGQAVDERADQFSFCVSLYFALYGQFPFAGTTPEEYEGNVLHGRIDEAPSAAKAPRWLREVLVRGLSVQPEARWPSMDALLAQISRDPGRTLRRWLYAGGAALGVLALTVGLTRAQREQRQLCIGAERKLIGVWDDARRSAMHRAFAATGLPYAEATFAGTQQVLDKYASAWTRMHVESCEATRVHGEQSEELLDLRAHCLNKRRDELRAVSDLFVQADAELVRRSDKVLSALGAIEECADIQALRAPVRRPTDPVARAALDRIGAEQARVDALQQAGRVEAAGRLAKTLLPEVQATHYRPAEAELLFAMAKIERHNDLASAAETGFQSALAAEAGHDDLHAIESWSYLVYLDGQRRKFEDAHRDAKIVQALLERAGHPPHLEALFWNDYGDLLDDEDKRDEAIEALRRSIRIREQLHGSEHENLAMSLNDLGVVLLHHGLLEQSMAVEQRALQLWESSLGPNHPKVSMALTNIGEALLELNRVAEAEKTLERALSIDREAFGPNSDDVAYDLEAHATVRLAQKRFEEALREGEQALAMRAADDRGRVLDVIGRAQLGLGRVREAVATLRKAVTVYARDRYYARTEFHLARALWEAGERGEALKLAERARASAAASVGAHGIEPELREMDDWLAARQARATGAPK